MVSIVTKKIKGNEYLYLVDSIRKGDKVTQKTIKYIGKKRIIPKEEFQSMKLSYEKKDWVLNGFKDEFSYQDHEKMKKASSDYTSYLKSLDKVSKEKHKEKFLSIFISNSNAIEGSTLTVKETFNFLFQDVSPKESHSKKELFMASNLLRAWEYVEKNYTKLPTKEDVCNLHKLVNQGIEVETLGKYKQVQNYVGEVYTSSYLFVEERMEQLFYWIKEAFKKINDFEVAFQFHVQFEMIHPFVDGNGRVGRLLINWLLMYKKLLPLAIYVTKRGDYLSALNTAGKGKIEAMCSFCFKEYLTQYVVVN